MRRARWRDLMLPLGSPTSSSHLRGNGESLFRSDAGFNRFRDGVGTDYLQSGDIGRPAARRRCRENGLVEAEASRLAESALDLANRTKLAGKTDLADCN